MACDHNGKLIDEVVFEDLEINPELADELFQF